MRKLSRHLPTAKAGLVSPWARVFGILLLTVSLFGLGHALWLHPFAIPVLFIFALLLGWLAKRHDDKLRRLAQSRPHDSICTFARALNPRKTDPWIIRAAYEELGSLLPKTDRPFPLRASDRLAEDLKIDEEDRDDSFVSAAERVGRSLKNTLQNPYFDKVKTVEDFVMFLEHQPRVAA